MADSPALQIELLTFTYPGPVEPGGAPWSLRVPSLTLARGEQMLLAARSGVGKSTLLSIIAGLMEPATGTVRVAGQSVHALRGAVRDRFRGTHIGMIFQTFNLLLGFSALENVEAALAFSGSPRAGGGEKARALLDSLGIQRVRAPVETLSVGQQQRVAVARAVVCDPVVVLADEPTASLDPENAAGAMSLIQETCRAKGAALLCVSHDPAMWSRFERKENL